MHPAFRAKFPVTVTCIRVNAKAKCQPVISLKLIRDSVRGIGWFVVHALWYSIKKEFATLSKVNVAKLWVSTVFQSSQNFFAPDILPFKLTKICYKRSR